MQNVFGFIFSNTKPKYKQSLDIEAQKSSPNLASVH